MKRWLYTCSTMGSSLSLSPSASPSALLSGTGNSCSVLSPRALNEFGASEGDIARMKQAPG